MAKFKKWCTDNEESVNGHRLHVLTADATKLIFGINAVASMLPGHYASDERIAGILQRLGKTKASEYIRSKLPTTKNIRSGDLGEILGASFIAEYTGYTTGIYRLRWKDHREMAMRGDDLIAVRADAGSKVKFLKGEVKSRASLTAGTVSTARKALLSNKNRPSAHALGFVADRLHEVGEHGLGNLVDDAMLDGQIKLSQISHMVFTLSGNNPANLLRNDLTSYSGRVRQYSVGLYVQNHQAFIAAVYDKVTSNGV
jgi:Cap4 SAVED domain